MAKARRKPSDPSMGMPWTREEDDKLREITAIGLASEFWHIALPRRSHGAICNRRLELRIKPAALV